MKFARHDTYMEKKIHMQLQITHLCFHYGTTIMHSLQLTLKIVQNVIPYYGEEKTITSSVSCWSQLSLLDNNGVTTEIFSTEKIILFQIELK